MGHVTTSRCWQVHVSGRCRKCWSGMMSVVVLAPNRTKVNRCLVLLASTSAASSYKYHCGVAAASLSWRDRILKANHRATRHAPRATLVPVSSARSLYWQGWGAKCDGWLPVGSRRPPPEPIDGRGRRWVFRCRSDWEQARTAATAPPRAGIRTLAEKWHRSGVDTLECLRGASGSRWHCFGG